jgi:hypothetical protein
MANEAQVIYIRNYLWWQNPIDAALELVRVAGFEVDHTDINAENGAVTISFKLPLGMSEAAAYNQLVGWSGSRDVPVTFIAEDSPVGEIPPPMWWEKLREPVLGQRVRIYAQKKEVVHVWSSPQAGLPPEKLTTRTLHYDDPAHSSAEVWHAPVPGSKWLCIYDGALDSPPNDMVLWVNADDVQPEPP